MFIQNLELYLMPRPASAELVSGIDATYMSERRHIHAIYLLFFTQNLEQYLKRRRAPAVLLNERDTTYTLQKKKRIILTDFIQCVYM